MPYRPRQQHFRIRRNDTQALNSTTWTGDPALDTSLSVAVDTTFRVRFDIYEGGGVNGSAEAWRLRAQKNGAGGYTDVTSSRTDGLKLSLSGQFADMDNATQVISSGGSGYVNGRGFESSTASGTIQLSANYHMEHEFSLTMDSSVANNGDYWDLEVYRGTSTALYAYDVIPRITAVKNLTPSTNQPSIVKDVVTGIVLSALFITGVSDSCKVGDSASVQEHLQVPAIIETVKVIDSITIEETEPPAAEPVQINIYDNIKATDPYQWLNDRTIVLDQPTVLLGEVGLQASTYDTVVARGSPNLSLTAQPPLSASTNDAGIVRDGSTLSITAQPALDLSANDKIVSVDISTLSITAQPPLDVPVSDKIVTLDVPVISFGVSPPPEVSTLDNVIVLDVGTVQVEGEALNLSLSVSDKVVSFDESQGLIPILSIVTDDPVIVSEYTEVIGSVLYIESFDSIRVTEIGKGRLPTTGPPDIILLSDGRLAKKLTDSFYLVL